MFLGHGVALSLDYSDSDPVQAQMPVHEAMRTALSGTSYAGKVQITHQAAQTGQLWDGLRSRLDGGMHRRGELVELCVHGGAHLFDEGDELIAIGMVHPAFTKAENNPELYDLHGILFSALARLIRLRRLDAHFERQLA